MKNYQLRRFENPAVLAEAAATCWLDALLPLDSSRPYLVALAGGRIARDFFSAITRLARTRQQPLPPALHFFWGDERCVAPTDPESNYRVARELLLEPLAVPDLQIHRIRGELEPRLAAAEAVAELTGLAPRASNGQPVLDMVFLGLGENGHTASLFPEEPPQIRSLPDVYRPVVATKPPPQRVTLGYPALAAARDVTVLASGTGKEQALSDSLAPGGHTPLGRVLAERSHSTVFTDIALS